MRLAPQQRQQVGCLQPQRPPFGLPTLSSPAYACPAADCDASAFSNDAIEASPTPPELQQRRGDWEGEWHETIGIFCTNVNNTHFGMRVPSKLASAIGFNDCK